MRVAVLGTGIMGAGMARSLLRAGHDVSAWNRTADRARPLAADGAQVAATPREAADGADVVLTMLYDNDSVIEVVDDAAEAFGSAALWLQSSTIGPGGMARAEELARRRSLTVLDAPVLGTKQPAESGALVVLASGDPGGRDRAQPVFDAIGSKVVWVGDEVGMASRLKLVCNAWIATVNAGVAQSLALADANGLDPALFHEALADGPLDLPYARAKSAAMLGGSFEPSFALDGVRKDIGLMREAAFAAGVDDSLLSSLSEVYEQASRRGHGGDDMAAVYTAFRTGDGS